jgi:predicted nucleotidyltransferase
MELEIFGRAQKSKRKNEWEVKRTSREAARQLVESGL